MSLKQMKKVTLIRQRKVMNKFKVKRVNKEKVMSQKSLKRNMERRKHERIRKRTPIRKEVQKREVEAEKTGFGYIKRSNRLIRKMRANKRLIKTWKGKKVINKDQ